MAYFYKHIFINIFLYVYFYRKYCCLVVLAHILSSQDGIFRSMFFLILQLNGVEITLYKFIVYNYLNKASYQTSIKCSPVLINYPAIYIGVGKLS